MKKNLISLAVAASVLGGAAAQAGQYLNPEGTGQVLMFPFYNADNGNATNMHIVNTTAEAKALKVRFVEYKNSDEVLDFNLYLSPNDHFAFGVIKNPNGTGGAVITADNSCTVPALGSANAPFDGTVTTNATGSTTRVQPFVNYQYANSLDVDSTIERSLMGHVEVIEMGVLNNVDDGVAPLTALELKTQYASFAKHGATGVPANCAALAASWVGAPADTDAFAVGGVTAPTGGIYGLAYHINVESAAAFGFEPAAIDQWNTLASHSDPGSLAPSLANGSTAVTVHSPLLVPQYSSQVAASSAQATSANIMTSEIMNDVMVNPAIGGMTDWVISFPTKRLHVDGPATDLVAPFTDNWLGSTLVGTVKKEKPACEPVSIVQYNREELTTTAGLGFSPKPSSSVTSICNEVAVVAMGPAGTASALNVTTGLTNLGASYTEGWQRIRFTNTNSRAGGGNKTQKMQIGASYLTGLPVIGFGAYKVSNGAMSYGNASEHKTSVIIS